MCIFVDAAPCEPEKADTDTAVHAPAAHSTGSASSVKASSSRCPKCRFVVAAFAVGLSRTDDTSAPAHKATHMYLRMENQLLPFPVFMHHCLTVQRFRARGLRHGVVALRPRSTVGTRNVRCVSMSSWYTEARAPSCVKRLRTGTRGSSAQFPRKSRRTGPQVFQEPLVVVPKRFTQLCEWVGKRSCTGCAPRVLGRMPLTLYREGP